MTCAFAAGDAVRVIERVATGHTRTPRYIRGKRGVVERVCGAFRNPEELAYGRALVSRDAMIGVAIPEAPPARGRE